MHNNALTRGHHESVAIHRRGRVPKQRTRLSAHAAAALPDGSGQTISAQPAQPSGLDFRFVTLAGLNRRKHCQQRIQLDRLDGVVIETGLPRTAQVVCLPPSGLGYEND